MIKFKTGINFSAFNPINRMSRQVAREMVQIGREVFGVEINRRAAKSWLDRCCGINSSWVDVSTQEYFLFHEDAFVFTYEFLGIARLVPVPNVEGEFIVNSELKAIEKQYYQSKSRKYDKNRKI